MAKRRIQFSLLALLGITALLACALGILRAERTAMTGVLVIVMACTLPAVFITGVVCGRGYRRAFCIGALVPTALATVLVIIEIESMGSWQADQIAGMKWLARLGGAIHRIYGAFALCAVFAGCACVIVRWLFEDRDPHEGDHNRSR